MNVLHKGLLSWVFRLGQKWSFGQFCHARIEVLQNCSAFFVSVSLIELRENKKHIIQTLAVSRRFVSENWLAMTTRHKLIMKNDPIWKQSKDLTRFKVRIFWEGHNILLNLHLTFVYLQYRQTKVRWRFRKILRPSQNIWTLIKYVERKFHDSNGRKT
mgnify:CR=1 FL=1